MTNKDIALLILDGLIAGMESGSSILVQLSELKTLKILLSTPEAGREQMILPAPPKPPATRIVRDDRKPR